MLSFSYFHKTNSFFLLFFVLLSCFYFQSPYLPVSFLVLPGGSHARPRRRYVYTYPLYIRFVEEWSNLRRGR